MKKIAMLMLLSIAATMSMKAAIHANDQRKYVKLLLKQSKHCIELATTRKQRNLSTEQAKNEIEMCQEVAALLKYNITVMNEIVAETRKKPYEKLKCGLLFGIDKEHGDIYWNPQQ